ncbi:alpha/beta hydrolase [Pasteurellaceae bacterium Pebbles2]|nr:alpha/beta hydrolase [Pasteurellaceae bacterium Pebbles2]
MLKNIYITHGYTANSSKHWFPWLKQQLKVRSKNNEFSTALFDMPNSSQPDPQQWLAYHQQQIQHLDEHSYFIGHSLGCVATLRYLQQMKKKIGGVILVAGFAEPLPNLPELDAFCTPALDFDALINLIPKRLVIASDDDDVVNVQFSRNLAQNLQADYIELTQHRHFLDRQGITECPIIYEKLMEMLG